MTRQKQIKKIQERASEHNRKLAVVDSWLAEIDAALDSPAVPAVEETVPGIGRVVIPQPEEEDD